MQTSHHLIFIASITILNPYTTDMHASDSEGPTERPFIGPVLRPFLAVWRDREGIGAFLRIDDEGDRCDCIAGPMAPDDRFEYRGQILHPRGNDRDRTTVHRISDAEVLIITRSREETDYGSLWESRLLKIPSPALVKRREEESKT